MNSGDNKAGGGCCSGSKATKPKGKANLAVNKQIAGKNNNLFSTQPSGQTIIDAKIVLLGDSGVGKSSVA
jgi:putative ribosome biogenesis GTPase RsgA